MTLIKPALDINTLYRLNQKIPRRLEPSYSLMTGNHQTWHLLDSLNRSLSADPINVPQLLTVWKIDPEHRTLSVHAYDAGGEHVLSLDKVRLMLGHDYVSPGPTNIGTSNSDLENICQAITSCPNRAANAYVIGAERSVERVRYVAVQYFRIDPRLHRSLSLSKKTFTKRADKSAEFAL